MRERIITGIFVLAILTVFIGLKLQYIPALMIFFFMLYEITERTSSNYWLALSFFHIFGILIAITMDAMEISYVALIVILNDSMAYFGGKYLNFNPLKEKIFPKTSPNKIWGGFLYGIYFALIGSLLFYCFGEKTVFISEALFKGLIISLSAVFGDWLNSKFKRSHQIKDSCDGLWTEGLLKGHGGFYDRFDAFSMALWAWLIIKHF